jgi:hypothetical protein
MNDTYSLFLSSVYKGGSMLELAHEYGGDLLNFMEKYGKFKKKGFWSTDLLRKGHGVQRSSRT